MRAGYVPIDEIGPTIRELIKERWPHGSGYEVLAEKIGCDESAIYSIGMVENPNADFDLVDRIFCGLGRQDMWWGRFLDIYLSVEFRATCAAPGCSKRFAESKRGVLKLYCSRRCKAAASNVRRGLGSGNTRKGLCRKGLHRITGDNIVVQNGRRTCRECRRERHRRWATERRKDPAWRENRNEAQRRWRARLATG